MASTNIVHLQKEIVFLVKNYKKIIENLKNELKTRFNSFYKLYHTSTSQQKLIIESLVEKEIRPTQIEPLTIGAFLFGCQQYHYGALDKEESILCYRNIGGNSDINIQLWYVSESLKRINYVPDSEIGYIFVPINFKKFTLGMINKLKRYGIKRGSIYKTQYNKHFIYNPIDGQFTVETLDNISINQFPCYKNIKVSSLKKKHRPKKVNYAVGIVIVIFILLILFIIARRG